MFSRSVLTAFLVAAAFSDAVTGASLSGRDKVELTPRGLAVAAPRYAHLDTRAANSAEWSAHFGMWSRLAGSFAQCQSTFQSRVDVNIAFQSVNTLYGQVQDLCNQDSGYIAEVNIDERMSFEFRQVITQVFVSWQAILITGRETYGYSWNYYFRPAFARFSILIQTISTMCAHLRIDFRGLLLGLNLDLNIFVDAGVNVGASGGGNLSY